MFEVEVKIKIKVKIKVEVEVLVSASTLASVLVSILNSFAVPQLQLWQTVAKRFKISNNDECKNNS